MQLSIFDAPYQAHSATSRSAAQSVATKAPALRELVYEALRSRPMTDEEIAIALDMSPNTARPRRVELVKAGRVCEVGKALTASGRAAVLWGVA